MTCAVVEGRRRPSSSSFLEQAPSVTTVRSGRRRRRSRRRRQGPGAIISSATTTSVPPFLVAVVVVFFFAASSATTAMLVSSSAAASAASASVAVAAAAAARAATARGASMRTPSTTTARNWRLRLSSATSSSRRTATESSSFFSSSSSSAFVSSSTPPPLLRRRPPAFSLVPSYTSSTPIPLRLTTSGFDVRPTQRRRWPSLRPLASSASSSTEGTSVTSTSEESGNHDDSDDTAASAKVVVPRKFNPHPFQYREELTLRVESLTNLGLGVCRAELPPELLNEDNGESEEEENNASAAEEGEDGAGKRKRRRRRRRRGKKPQEDKGALPPEVVANDPDLDDSSSGGRPRRWVVMVPSVIPGELIKCRIFRNRSGFSEADLVEVVEPSPDRVTPACELFDKCGGCQYQHMNVGLQREWKRRQVTELFERVGKFHAGNGEGCDCPEVLPTLGTDEVYHYRSKITPHYDRPSPGRIPGLVEIDAIGFKEKTSCRLVDVPYCHIATEAINVKLAEYREEKFAEAKEGRLKKPSKGATLLLRDAFDESSGDSVVSTDNNEYVLSGPIATTDDNDDDESDDDEGGDSGGVDFRFQAGNFFQNNPHVLPLMLSRVSAAASLPNARTGDAMTHLIDCYCGSGLFALGSASKFDVCVGIEVNDRAVREATDNALRNGIRNCKFAAASAEAIFKSNDPVEVAHAQTGEVRSELVRDFPRSTTTVVVDPPRKGCSPEFLAQLEDFGPQRVVYMSCDPATQARDARAIADAGYNIVSVEPIDLFPQTRHIECLAVFERRG